jgi:GT2 family glycosyltransferase
MTCVIVVNWNGKSLLNKCLSSLFSNTDDETSRVVVVDNGSSDGSPEMVLKDFPQVTLIQNKVNVGFSKANNQGIRYAIQHYAKYVLLLNSDIEITDKHWLKEFTTVIESDSKIGIVGCKLVFADGKLQHAGGRIALQVPYHRGECENDTGQYDRVELVDYVTGAAMLVKAEVIRKIGILDEGFSPVYYEDTDWCVRARLSGYEIAYTPKPTLIHHCGASSKKLGGERKWYYAKRNFIRFTLLNYSTKAIFKRLFLYDSQEVIRCFIVKSKHGPLPLTLRSDTANRLKLLWRPWQANIRNLKGILYLRRQRLRSGVKLPV